MALNKKNRLKKRKDFEEVFKKGKAVKSSFLFSKYVKNDLGSPRLAFVVSSKVSGKAVERNKIRRRLSSIFDKKLKTIPAVDWVLISDKKIKDASHEDLIIDVETIIQKIK